LKGGLGSASLVDAEGIAVGALAAVNSFGSVLLPKSRAFWSWPYEIDGEFGAVRPPSDYVYEPDHWGAAKASPHLRRNTTLGVVAVGRRLTPAQARRVAVMAQDGLSRAVRPAHAPFDGDVVFVLAVGDQPLPEPEPYALSVLGERAAACLSRAIARGVYEAEALPGGPQAWRDLS
jgi:L-aminopeptidase/D-esterase-like protein